METQQKMAKVTKTILYTLELNCLDSRDYIASAPLPWPDAAPALLAVTTPLAFHWDSERTDCVIEVYIRILCALT